MDELDGGGEPDMALAGISAHPSSRQRQQRAQALAAGIDEVARHVGNQGNDAAQPFVDQRIGRAHVGRDQGEQALDRRNAGIFRRVRPADFRRKHVGPPQAGLPDPSGTWEIGRPLKRGQARSARVVP